MSQFLLDTICVFILTFLFKEMVGIKLPWEKCSTCGKKVREHDPKVPWNC